MFPEAYLTATLLAAGAGLSTTLGSLVAVFWREPGPGYMALALGFSAGVMIHVSYVELLQGGMATLAAGSGGGVAAFAIAHLALFGGFLVMFLIDVLVSHSYLLESAAEPTDGGAPLRRMSLMVALGVAIHNFPEGMATFAGTLQDTALGVSIAVAIAMHNIPEGIAVAVPIYAATGSAKRAFLWSFLSGVSEPVGALAAGLILLPFLTPTVLACALCAVGGFMIYIAFDELLPVAQSYGRHHLAIIGVLAGMAVMAVSLALLR